MRKLAFNNARTVCSLLVISALFLTGCNIVDAREHPEVLNAAQQRYVEEVLEHIQPDTTKKELVQLLGSPVKDIGFLIDWAGPDGDAVFGRVRLYIFDGKIGEIRWMDLLDGFKWQKRFFEEESN
jgi:hypothetical protein